MKRRTDAAVTVIKGSILKSAMSYSARVEIASRPDADRYSTRAAREEAEILKNLALAYQALCNARWQ